MAVILVRKGELQLGTQQLVSFRSSKADVGSNDSTLCMLHIRCVFALLAAAGAVAIVGTSLAGCSHIRDSGQNGMLAALCNIFFRADGGVKDLPQGDHTDSHYKTQ